MILFMEIYIIMRWLCKILFLFFILVNRRSIFIYKSQTASTDYYRNTDWVIIRHLQIPTWIQRHSQAQKLTIYMKSKETKLMSSTRCQAHQMPRDDETPYQLKTILKIDENQPPHIHRLRPHARFSATFNQTKQRLKHHNKVLFNYSSGKRNTKRECYLTTNYILYMKSNPIKY